MVNKAIKLSFYVSLVQQLRSWTCNPEIMGLCLTWDDCHTPINSG